MYERMNKCQMACAALFFNSVDRDLPLSLFRRPVFYGNNTSTAIITEKALQIKERNKQTNKNKQMKKDITQQTHECVDGLMNQGKVNERLDELTNERTTRTNERMNDYDRMRCTLSSLNLEGDIASTTE